MGCSPWGRTELDSTEATQHQQQQEEAALGPSCKMWTQRWGPPASQDEGPPGAESAAAWSWSSSLQHCEKPVQSTVLEQPELTKKISVAKHRETTLFSSWRAEEAENGD